jgi:prepilin-type N-terminal cleavage/methylation domain-containing protein
MLRRRKNCRLHFSIRRQPNDGFTLIELLVALALLSLMAALLAGIVNASRQTIGILERNETANSIGPAQNFLRSAVSRIVTTNQSGNGQENQPLDFIGDPSHLKFTTSYSTRGQFEGTYTTEIAAKSSPDLPNTIDLTVVQHLARLSHQDGSPNPAPPHRSRLLTNIKTVSFAYFGRKGSELEEWQWHNEWREPNRHPSLIRIEVTFAKGDPRIWYRLHVPLNQSN